MLQEIQHCLAAALDLVVAVHGRHRRSIHGHAKLLKYVEKARLAIGHALIQR